MSIFNRHLFSICIAVFPLGNLIHFNVYMETKKMLMLLAQYAPLIKVQLK